MTHENKESKFSSCNMWIGCVSIVMIINIESEIGNLSSNSVQVCCIHFHINALGKGTNPFSLPLPMG